MRNRLATAVTLAYDIALSEARKEGKLSKELEGAILDRYDEVVRLLLRGEQVDDIKLSGDNEMAVDYALVIAKLDAETSPQPEIKGYQE